MGKIDCLFIGHNEMNFEEYCQCIESKGERFAFSREFSYNYIKNDNKRWTIHDIVNKAQGNNSQIIRSFGNFNTSSIFNLAVAYLSTFVHRRDFSFSFVNSFTYEKPVLKEKLLNNDILLIAITTTLYFFVDPIIEIMNFIRKYNKKTKVIVGGPFIITNLGVNDPIINDFIFHSIGADFYVYSSQGERALVDVLTELKSTNDFSKINNLIYRKNDNYIYSMGKQIEDNPLNENMIDWKLFEGHVKLHANLRTAISCPFKCKYCEFPKRAGKYRPVDVASIENELKSLDALDVTRSVYFVDDTFNVPLSRFKKILMMIIKNKFKFRWNSFLRCHALDEEAVQLMVESGCDGVILGIESGSEKILKNMNKSATIAQNERGIELLHKYNITTFASLIIGLPGETESTYRKTFEFIERNQPDFFRAHIWFASLLTPIMCEKGKYDIKGAGYEWSHMTMNSSQASDLEEDLFLNIKNSIWCPNHNFDYPAIPNLLQRNMNIEQIKRLLSAFNSEIKLRIRRKQNTSMEALNHLIELAKTA